MNALAIHGDLHSMVPPQRSSMRVSFSSRYSIVGVPMLCRSENSNSGAESKSVLRWNGVRHDELP